MSISRRKFIGTSAGAAGIGLALSSAPQPLLAAQDTANGADGACPALPQPIPHTIATPFGTTIHFFFPGPVEGDPNNSDAGHDPSVITDFSGIIGQADLDMTGTGTDFESRDTAPYDFHADMRFMDGEFVAADGERHRGAFAFV